MLDREKLHIGTSGWSYDHWRGIFYPAGIKPDEFLEYYTAYFSSVELNSSFYHLPMVSTVKRWINRTPDSFRFCPKLSRMITHQLLLQNTEESLEKFLGIFELLKEKLGPVLIQLPPALKFDRLLITVFFDLLTKCTDHFQFAIEVRHKSWINDIFFDLLASYKIALVMADSGLRYPYCEIITTDFVYLRFHGREKLYATDYKEDDLLAYGEKIRQWMSAGLDVWIFFNNDFHGYAVKNALRLKEIAKFNPENH